MVMLSASDRATTQGKRSNADKQRCQYHEGTGRECRRGSRGRSRRKAYALPFAAAGGARGEFLQVRSGHAGSECDVVLARHRIAGSAADEARVRSGASVRERKVTARQLTIHRRQNVTRAVGKTARSLRCAGPTGAHCCQDCNQHRLPASAPASRRRLSRCLSPSNMERKGTCSSDSRIASGDSCS